MDLSIKNEINAPQATMNEALMGALFNIVDGEEEDGAISDVGTVTSLYPDSGSTTDQENPPPPPPTMESTHTALAEVAGTENGNGILMVPQNGFGEAYDSYEAETDLADSRYLEQYFQNQSQLPQGVCGETEGYTPEQLHHLAMLSLIRLSATHFENELEQRERSGRYVYNSSADRAEPNTYVETRTQTAPTRLYYDAADVANIPPYRALTPEEVHNYNLLSYDQSPFLAFESHGISPLSPPPNYTSAMAEIHPTPPSSSGAFKYEAAYMNQLEAAASNVNGTQSAGTSHGLMTQSQQRSPATLNPNTAAFFPRTSTAGAMNTAITDSVPSSGYFASPRPSTSTGTVPAPPPYYHSNMTAHTQHYQAGLLHTPPVPYAVVHSNNHLPTEQLPMAHQQPAYAYQQAPLQPRYQYRLAGVRPPAGMRGLLPLPRPVFQPPITGGYPYAPRPRPLLPPLPTSTFYPPAPPALIQPQVPGPQYYIVPYNMAPASPMYPGNSFGYRSGPPAPPYCDYSQNPNMMMAPPLPPIGLMNGQGQSRMYPAQLPISHYRTYQGNLPNIPPYDQTYARTPENYAQPGQHYDYSQNNVQVQETHRRHSKTSGSQSRKTADVKPKAGTSSTSAHSRSTSIKKKYAASKKSSTEQSSTSSSSANTSGGTANSDGSKGTTRNWSSETEEEEYEYEEIEEEEEEADTSYEDSLKDDNEHGEGDDDQHGPEPGSSNSKEEPDSTNHDQGEDGSRKGQESTGHEASGGDPRRRSVGKGRQHHAASAMSEKAIMQSSRGPLVDMILEEMVNFNYTYYMRGQEFPYVSSVWDPKVVMSQGPVPHFAYYVPPRVEDDDFFG